MAAFVDTTRVAAVDAVLRSVRALVGMEAAYLGQLTPSTFTFVRVDGGWAGVHEGNDLPPDESFCARMIGGAPSLVGDAAREAAYADVPARSRLGVGAYAGVPVLAADGSLLGTLAAANRGPVEIDDACLPALHALATALAAVLSPIERPAAARLLRTRAGWVVEAADGEVRPAEDLTSAMVIADLLSPDLAPAVRPARAAAELDEIDRLRISVIQLEHALASRVLVEQAIGVLAERHGLRPREAFERLRRVSRARGRRVHDLAREVVDSVSGHGNLPAELASAPSRVAALRR